MPNKNFSIKNRCLRLNDVIERYSDSKYIQNASKLAKRELEGLQIMGKYLYYSYNCLPRINFDYIIHNLPNDIGAEVRC